MNFANQVRESNPREKKNSQTKDHFAKNEGVCEHHEQILIGE